MTKSWTTQNYLSSLRFEKLWGHLIENSTHEVVEEKPERFNPDF